MVPFGVSALMIDLSAVASRQFDGVGTAEQEGHALAGACALKMHLLARGSDEDGEGRVNINFATN